MPKFLMRYAMISGMAERQLDSVEELQAFRLEVQSAGGTVVSIRDEGGRAVRPDMLSADASVRSGQRR